MASFKDIKGMELTDNGGWNVLTKDGTYHEFHEPYLLSYQAGDNNMPQVDLNNNMVIVQTQESMLILAEIIQTAQKSLTTVIIPGPMLTVIGPRETRQIPIEHDDTGYTIPVQVVEEPKTIRVWAHPPVKATPVNTHETSGPASG